MNGYTDTERYTEPATIVQDRTFRRGDIFYFSDAIQSEGSEQRPGRPGIIVSNDAFNATSGVVEAVFLTSRPKRYMNTHAIINSTARQSVALCEQIRTIDKRKIGTYYGRATEEEMRNVDNALLHSIGMGELTNGVDRREVDEIKKKYSIVESQLKKYKAMYDELYSELIG